MSTQNVKSQFIEETGLVYERMGLTRMAGRIHGYLMVTDKEPVSFDELAQVLQASKSAISTNVRALINIKFIKPVTLPGDRKTYYSLSPDIPWSELLREKMQELVAVRKHFDKGLELRMNKSDKQSLWLANASEFYGWMSEEFPLILDRWEEHKQNHRK
jgi:DNA-binding transcriptional regulator GbsR (MarR family)